MNRMPSSGARRAFLRACVAAPATFVLAACTGQAAITPSATPAAALPTPAAPTAPMPAPTAAPTAAPPATTAASPTAAPTTAPTAVAQVLAPTPACGDDDDEPTPAQTEGPYFTPNSPERVSLLEDGVTGTRLVISGTVLTTGCAGVARAIVDFWHADDAGAYDNVGYRLRGHQFTDDQGRWALETIMPGLYTGRTRHIHVKVQAPDGPVLTTQLYFPDEPGNARDGIFNPALVMAMQSAADGQTGTFDFVI